jgi:sodium transport system permease protein
VNLRSVRLDPARIAAFLGAQLRGVRRARGALVSYALLTFALGALGPAVRKWTARPPPKIEVEARETAWPCQPDVMPSVAMAGDPPEWLDWPDDPVEPDEADMLLRFSTEAPADPLQIEIVVLEPMASPNPVRECVQDRIETEERRRLLALGVAEDPGALVAVRRLDEGGGEGSSRPPPIAAFSLLTSLFFTLVGVFADECPRARTSGWLEAALTLPGSRGDLVVAWWILGLLFGGSTALLVAAGNALGVGTMGAATGAVPWGLAPILIATLSALAVRAFIDAPDVRTASLAVMPYLILLSIPVGIAMLLERWIPGLGGAVPVAGIGLAFVGRASGTIVPILSATVGTGLLLGDAVRVLDRLEVREGPLGRTAARRARGDFLPEAALLVLCAIAGMTGGLPPDLLTGDPAVRTGLSLLLFLALPAWMASVPLALDRRELLSLRRPRSARAWALVPLVVPGTICSAALLWDLALRFVPHDDSVAMYAEAVQDLATPQGILVLALAPAVCEELLFRGALLGLLRKRFPAWAAVVLQAAAFALLHAIGVRFPYTFALGLVLGLIVVRTGSLGPAMAVHACHNLVAALLPEDVLARVPAGVAVVLGAVAVAAAWAMGGPSADAARRHGPPGDLPR